MSSTSSRVLAGVVTGMLLLAEPAPAQPLATAPAASPAQDSTATAFVLDRRQRAVSMVDAISGESKFTRFAADAAERGSSESMDVLAVSPDGARLAVIDAGRGDFSLPNGWRPRRQSSIVILDARTLDLVARAEGVWGMPLHAFSRDGRRLTVVGSGVRRYGDQPRREAEAVTIDMHSGAVLGRKTLDSHLRESDRWFHWFGNAALSADGEQLYLLDPGKPSRDRLKHLSGRLTVIALSNLEVAATLPVGAVPLGLVADAPGNQTFVLSDHAPYARSSEERTGEVRVVRGAEVVATIPVAAAPQFIRFTPDRQSILVVSGEDIVTLDAVALAAVGRTAVPRAGITFWALGDWWSKTSRRIKDVVVDPTGRRAYAIHEDSSQLSVLDLETRTRVATVTTGRIAPKITAFTSALMASMASYHAGQQFARATGASVFFYTTYHVLAAHTELAMRPDGRVVYVLNWQSQDLTIVDADKASIIGHVPDVGLEFETLPEANLLSVRGPKGLRFFDMRSNGEVKDLALSAGANRMALSPDARRLFVATSGSVITLDARTGRFLAAFPEFDDPFDVVFSPVTDARRRAEIAPAIAVDVETANATTEVELAVEPTEAAVSLDGQSLESATRLVTVPPGRHVIDASHPGRVSARRELDIPAGGRVRVELTLERSATAASTENELAVPTNWAVWHLHGASSCGGRLYLKGDRLGYLASPDEGHNWEVPLSEVQEIAGNRSMGGGLRYGGAFHVKLAAGGNYNFTLNAPRLFNVNPPAHERQGPEVVSQLQAALQKHKRR